MTNQQEFNQKMTKILMVQYKDGYTQGVIDTVLLIQDFMNLLSNKNDVNYENISKILNDILSEKIYKNNIK
jgi:hypothetical protein